MAPRVFTQQVRNAWSAGRPPQKQETALSSAHERPRHRDRRDRDLALSVRSPFDDIFAT